jgi:hypothetical protein
MHITLKLIRLSFGVSLCSMFLLFSLSCSSTGEKKTGSETLLPSVEKFNNAVRWEEYKTAGLFLDTPLQKAYWNLVDRLQGLVKITGYEIRKIDQKEKSPFADVFICFRLYRTNDPYIRSVTLHQRWAYKEKGKHWVVAEHDLESFIEHER